MAAEVVMPRLGWTMETGRLVEWLKHDGDAVKAGENIFTVETDKALAEVEALDSGVLKIPPNAPPVDSDIPVGTVVAYLVKPDERPPWETGVTPPPQLDQDSPAVSAENPAGDGSDGPAPAPAPPTGSRALEDGPAISPRARRIASELGVDWTALQGSGRTGRIVERDVRTSVARRPAMAAVRATPLARRVAAEAGVDLDQLAQSVGGKRISRADVEAVAAPAPPVPEPGVRMPISPMRRIIAGRMAESAHTAAPVTLTTEADATELVYLRNRVKMDRQNEPGRVPTYTDLLVRVAALALIELPALNASFSGDTIVEHRAVHIGIAVDTERGLLVPVVRDAHLRSVEQIADETTRLIEAARASRAAPDDLQGGTFTITNLGMYEIDAFTPIINLPESAILGVGRIVARPVVIDATTEEIAAHKMMALSLTFDHRIVDGAPAARFLQRVKQMIEHPYSWLIR